MELTKDTCKNCTVENMCTTGTLPNSEECHMKGIAAEVIGTRSPIELTTVQTEFETKIVGETNIYLARMGYSIKFNKEELEEMLQMYLNPPLSKKWFQNNINEWIWDNKLKINVLFRFYRTNKYMPIRCCVRFWNVSEQKIEEITTAYHFEEGRFFAREVKE